MLVIDVLIAEIRSALRRLVRRPSAALVSIAALGCGIGAAAATWSLLGALLVDPLPVAAPERLFEVGIRSTIDGEPRGQDAHAYPVYSLVRDSGAFESVAAGGSWPVTSRDGEYSAPLEAYFASHDFFETLGVEMALGRDFDAADDRRGAAPTVILSDRYRRLRFGADPAVLGRTLRVGDLDAVVVGVAPPAFRGVSLSRAPQVYLPLHTVADAVSESPANFFAEPIPPARSSPIAWLTLIGRLPPGADAAAARARLEPVFRDAGAAAGDARAVLTNIETAAVPAASRAGMRRFVVLLGATVGLLMLTGCLAAGMLLLVGTEARLEELAVARALGASRPRVAAGVVAEGALLAAAGACAGVPVAYWLFRGIRAFDLPGRVPVELLELSVDPGVLVAAAAGAGVAMLVITCVALSFAGSVDVAGVPGTRAVVTTRRPRYGARSWLVVGQVAIALVLLVGTGLFARSLMAVLTLNPEHDTSRLVTGAIPLPSDRYSAEQADRFFDALTQRLRGHAAVAAVSTYEFVGGMGTLGQLDVDGVAREFPAFVRYEAVDARYFSTLGLGVLEGRAFSPTDRGNAPPVAIVSESLARELAGAGGALGREITTGNSRLGAVQVVGVVPDIVTDVDALEPLVLYLPAAQVASITPSRSILLRPAADTSTAISAAATAIGELDPEIIPEPLLTVDARLASQLVAQRFGVSVMGALGGVAALLTAMAIYVLAESTALGRRREFGVRAALGAPGWTLARRILAETARLVGLGVLIGLASSWIGASAISSFLFQVAPLDPVTLITVACAMLALALLVSLRPAVAAMRVDLARLMREE